MGGICESLAGERNSNGGYGLKMSESNHQDAMGKKLQKSFTDKPCFVI